MERDVRKILTFIVCYIIASKIFGQIITEALVIFRKDSSSPKMA